MEDSGEESVFHRNVVMLAAQTPISSKPSNLHIGAYHTHKGLSSISYQTIIPTKPLFVKYLRNEKISKKFK